MFSFGSPRRRGCSPARAHPFGQRTVAFRSFSHFSRVFGAIAVASMIMACGPAGAGGPQISHFTLDNGLEVVVIPDHRTPVVTHMIWYRVGSADEQAGKSGLAHFLEHLMF